MVGKDGTVDVIVPVSVGPLVDDFKNLFLSGL